MVMLHNRCESEFRSKVSQSDKTNSKYDLVISFFGKSPDMFWCVDSIRLSS